MEAYGHQSDCALEPDQLERRSRRFVSASRRHPSNTSWVSCGELSALAVGADLSQWRCLQLTDLLRLLAWPSGLFEDVSTNRGRAAHVNYGL